MSAFPIASPAPLPVHGNRIRLARGRLITTVCRSLDALAHFRPEWDQLAESTGTPIYQSYDWCRVWWKHYGAGREPRIYVFRTDDNELVGIAPFCIDSVRIGPVRLRVAKIMGSDFGQAVCDLPLHRDWTEAIFFELIQRLIQDDRCDAIHIGPISELSPRLGSARAAARRLPGFVTILRDRVAARHADLVLPDSFDAYLTALSKNARKAVRKGAKRLHRDFAVDARFTINPPDIADQFNAFVQLHQQQWRATGRLGHFGDWPKAEPFHRDLARAMARHGRTLFLSLIADRRFVAGHYGYVFGQRFHWLLTGRAVDPSWEPYSLGKTSLMPLIEHLIDHGVRLLDASVGHYDYKLRLGAREHNVRSILVAANQPVVISRARAFCACADALHRLYYRLWYSRIAPRIPGRRRALRQSWIQSRL